MNKTSESFSGHWLTIQPFLFNFLEDEVGELDEDQKSFVRVAESLGLQQITTILPVHKHLLFYEKSVLLRLFARLSELNHTRRSRGRGLKKLCALCGRNKTPPPRKLRNSV